MKREGDTHVLTLLSKKEGAEKIGELVRKSDLEWIDRESQLAGDNPDQHYEYYFEKLEEYGIERNGEQY